MAPLPPGQQTTPAPPVSTLAALLRCCWGHRLTSQAVACGYSCFQCSLTSQGSHVTPVAMRLEAYASHHSCHGVHQPRIASCTALYLANHFSSRNTVDGIRPIDHTRYPDCLFPPHPPPNPIRVGQTTLPLLTITDTPLCPSTTTAATTTLPAVTCPLTWTPGPGVDGAPNTAVDCTDGVEVGNSCTATCQGNYEATDLTATCGADGQWSTIDTCALKSEHLRCYQCQR